MIPSFLTADIFPSPIRHGFFTRQGGVSTGLCSSLNVFLSHGDTPANVSENLRRISSAMGTSPSQLVKLRQIHSSTVVSIPATGLAKEIDGDALITCHPQVLLGIYTADCVPILIADTQTPWIAAVHVGWKGAKSGVIQKTLEALSHQGVKRKNLVAALGPCIWAASYHVTEEFLAHFPESPHFFTPAALPKHWHFDLSGFVTELLYAQGISTIAPSPANTFEQEDRFFSNRRRSLRKEPAHGSQLSVIMRTP